MAIGFTNTSGTGWNWINSGSTATNNDCPAVGTPSNAVNNTLLLAAWGAAYPSTPGFSAQVPVLSQVTGETEIGSGVRYTAGSLHDVEIHAFYAALTGSPTNLNWDESTAGDRRVMGGGLIITGHDTVTPIRASAVNSGTGTTVTYPDTTSVNDGDMVVRIAMVGKEDVTQTFGAISGVTDIFNDPQSGNFVSGVYVGYAIKSGAGAPGTASMTLNTTRDWASMTIVIAVAGGGGSSIAAISTGYALRGMR